MSLIITIRTTEGAIMASDSRTTWSTNLSPDKTLVGIHFSDTANKLFLVGNRYGISTCGEASIRGRSISAWMDDLSTSEELNVESVRKVAEKVASFFGNMRPMKTVLFHISGYQGVKMRGGMELGMSEVERGRIECRRWNITRYVQK